MNLNLQDKNALVCGSSKGIGKAVAIELAKLGANVTLLARSSDKLAAVKAGLDQTSGQQHDFLVADFSQPEDLKKKVRELVSKKPIHILINNTGGPPGGPISEAETTAFLDAFRKHLICNHILTQAVAKRMEEEAYGRIINIISTSVKQPLDGLGVSNTIRGAVANWSKTMANELGRKGITVNNVLPGATSTERLQEIIQNKAKKTGQTPDAVSRNMKNSVPLGRFADPAEVAAAVAFLASPAAAYINGINLPVDGGRTKSL
jgi:3-oxoacyl-[acyl-carrier protein] reductase